MGTFGGHALPGSFFIVFALWWTIQIYRRYYQSLTKSGRKYTSTATFPCSCLCGKLRSWEMEGYVKIFFTTIGFILEIYTGFHEGTFVYLGNGQHATMFFFFGLSGAIDIMVHHKVPLPRGISYVGMAMALIVEGLLFKFHTAGREPLENLLHLLLIYAVFAGVVALGLEMAHRRFVLASLGRAYFTFLQGTWFWQVAFILYNPFPKAKAWDLTSMENATIVTMIFAWHMAGVFLVMMLLGAVIGCIYRNHGDFNANDYDSLSMNLITQSPKGHTIVNLNEDTDSDIEYEKPIDIRD